MRKVRQLLNTMQELVYKKDTEELRKSLFDFLFYSPKFPLRNQQQLLLNQAKHLELEVFDKYFEYKHLKINAFIWGTGDKTILLTHGWASKAIDFIYLIQHLLALDYRVISFDAPGNGSSEGVLTNLLLYVDGIYQVIEKCGAPWAIIGHSLGAMANVIAVNHLSLHPTLLLSITPLVNLENYFTTQLLHIGIDKKLIDQFYRDFFEAFHVEANLFDLNRLYENALDNHWLLYDENDKISPYEFMEDFLNKNPTIRAKAFNQVGHENMLKNEEVLSEILHQIETLSLN